MESACIFDCKDNSWKPSTPNKFILHMQYNSWLLYYSKKPLFKVFMHLFILILGNVLTVRRFLVCMQRELEERLNFRSFMLHITERDPALFSHHDLEVLNCDRSTNRERLQNLVRIIGDKGEDPNVLQNIYCSLKDSYESDDSLSQHYHLAQLFSLRGLPIMLWSRSFPMVYLDFKFHSFRYQPWNIWEDFERCVY